MTAVLRTSADAVRTKTQPHGFDSFPAPRYHSSPGLDYLGACTFLGINTRPGRDSYVALPSYTRWRQ